MRESYKTIELNNGYFVKVDQDDYDKFNKLRWIVRNEKSVLRAVRYFKDGSKYTVAYLSREIMNAPKGTMVDHINHDTLDNRKSNLRICSNHQNQANRKVVGSNNTSGYKGVGLNMRCTHKKWRSTIQVYGKKICLGYFESKEKAALAYNEAAKKHLGEFALLNTVDLNV